MAFKLLAELLSFLNVLFFHSSVFFPHMLILLPLVFDSFFAVFPRILEFVCRF